MWPDLTPDKFRELIGDYMQVRSIPPPSAGFDPPSQKLA
jgi:hypothetical protein